MANAFFNPQDAPSARQATCYVTISGKRYAMMNAKEFEAKAGIETAEVPILGKLIKGRKANGMTISFSMTVYKCSEMFDDVVEEFKKTGILPTFDIQVSSSDGAASIGTSRKIYRDCIIDGDVLLSMFDADGEFVEQTIEGYAMDYDTESKYKNPSYM
ncbi:MAG: hypothetical protein KH452_05920 [Clostridiales bacterium]|nr:hypothetical protein [Clostridiales bacterium]